MRLQTLQFRQLSDRCSSIPVADAGDRKRDENLVEVKQRAAIASEMFHLHVHDRVQDGRREQLDAVVDTGEIFQGVQKQGGGGPKQGRGSPGQNLSVLHLHGSGRGTCLFRLQVGGLHAGTV